jgi:hypothetical protein
MTVSFERTVLHQQKSFAIEPDERGGVQGERLSGVARIGSAADEGEVGGGEEVVPVKSFDGTPPSIRVVCNDSQTVASMMCPGGAPDRAASSGFWRRKRGGVSR